MLIYLSLISAAAVILTLYDKIAAKKLPDKRIPENVLLIPAFMGGAAAEYLTMLLIRHKTRHRKFMLTLPLLIVIHVVIAAFINAY